MRTLSHVWQCWAYLPLPLPLLYMHPISPAAVRVLGSTRAAGQDQKERERRWMDVLLHMLVDAVHV